MGFLSDLFGRTGRVARGVANQGVDALEDATFETTVKQTVADMKTELNHVVQSSAVAWSDCTRTSHATASSRRASIAMMLSAPLIGAHRSLRPRPRCSPQ